MVIVLIAVILLIIGGSALLLVQSVSYGMSVCIDKNSLQLITELKRLGYTESPMYSKDDPFVRIKTTGVYSSTGCLPKNCIYLSSKDKFLDMAKYMINGFF